MRTCNKKWSVQDCDDHYIITWRGIDVKIDREDFHFFEENIFRILAGTTGRSTDRMKYLYICHHSYKSGTTVSTYETFHRVIMNAPEGMVVDHINLDTLDNRKSNLRLTNVELNISHSRKYKFKDRHTTSKYKGVCYVKNRASDKKWSCCITLYKKRYHYYFLTEIEAAQKYNEMATKLLGEFAILNEIPDPQQK